MGDGPWILVVYLGEEGPFGKAKWLPAEDVVGNMTSG